VLCTVGAVLLLLRPMVWLEHGQCLAQPMVLNTQLGYISPKLLVPQLEHKCYMPTFAQLGCSAIAKPSWLKQLAGCLHQQQEA
jgi:hypothetical protein